jgi:hypothetical protein
MTLLEIVNRLLQLESKATPAPWKPFDSGPWGGQGSGVSIGSDIRLWPKFDDDTTEPGVSNAFLCAESRNHLRKLCQALKEANKIMKLSMDSEHSYNAWLKKYGEK